VVVPLLMFGSNNFILIHKWRICTEVLPFPIKNHDKSHSIFFQAPDIVDTYLIIPALDLELPRTSNIIIVDRKYYEHSQSMLLLLSSKTLRVG